MQDANCRYSLESPGKSAPIGSARARKEFSTKESGIRHASRSVSSPPRRMSSPSIHVRSTGRRVFPRVCILAVSALLQVPAFSQQGSAAPVSGELRTWHKLTWDFAGPPSGETAEPNPFTDYRLDVTFTHVPSGKTYFVPGYYAADGDAANSSADSGNVWRVHFAPDAAGEWTYSASFRSGDDVAVDEDPQAGQSAGFFDGESGSFTIQPTNKTGRDMRAKGRLEYAGMHHLRFAGTGEFFMKAGTDSPENLLSYADFDGDFKTDGEEDDLVKTWEPHIADWQEGDPYWQDGKGKGLIGAINYLASEGVNALSFLTMNINGDDKNVFPYLDYDERLRMDVSRLDQWEIVFGHGTRMGMHLHFKTQETENEKLLDSGNTGKQRRLYYRELIARFSHHLALNWNLGEEINDSSLAQKASWAQFFHDNDPYHHPIVIHNGASHFEMMGDASKLTGFSLQMNEEDFSDTFFQTRRYVWRSADFGRPWVVATDEPGDSRNGVRPDDDLGESHRDARRDALWANIMAGGAGCEFYFGYDWPNGDLTLQDFRSRDAFWDYCRHAIRFFEENPFHFELMGNHNELVSGSGDNANRCLARIGDTSLVQLRDGGSHTLDLSGAAGTYSVQWFNPRTGGPVAGGGTLEGGGSAELGAPPDTPDEDWIVLVKNLSDSGGTNRAPVVSAGPDKAAFLGGETVSVTLNGSATDDGLPDAFSLSRMWAQVSGPAPVSFSSTITSTTIATFTEPGIYTLGFTASDTEFTAYDEVEVAITLPQSGGVQTLLPVDDCFLEDGANENSGHLRVEAIDRLRVAYLKFDLSGLAAVPEHALLRLAEDDNPSEGEMTIRLYAGSSNDWTETSLDGENAPAKGAELAVFTGDIPDGGTVEFDLGSHFTENGLHTFILETDSPDRDVSFASKENPDAGIRPALVVTVPANSAPEFSGFLVATLEDIPVTLSHAEVLATATDAEGDALSLLVEDGGTSAGGDITSGEGYFTYTPSIDYLGADSFLLTVQDSKGGSVSAILDITVIAGSGIEGVSPMVERTPSGPLIRFTGVPGLGYGLQRSFDLVEWFTLEPFLRDAGGFIEYLDAENKEDRAFYRVNGP